MSAANVEQLFLPSKLFEQFAEVFFTEDNEGVIYPTEVVSCTIKEWTITLKKVDGEEVYCLKAEGKRGSIRVEFDFVGGTVLPFKSE